jgi:hypothetical protein
MTMGDRIFLMRAPLGEPTGTGHALSPLSQSRQRRLKQPTDKGDGAGPLKRD